MSKAVRLDRFLAEAVNGTRSEVKKQIQKGQVTVNGVVTKKTDQKVTVPPDEVCLNGQLLSSAPEFVYYLLHKPAGVVSATEDRRDQTVLDLIPKERRNLFPVGRLDKDTEGLLLITDDGQLAHELLSPKRHVDKTYYVIAGGIVGEEELECLRKGVDIGEKHPTLPAKAELIPADTPIRGSGPEELRHYSQPTTELLLTIHEGKFHQVKRMLQAVGSEVLYLRRISMGSLFLPEDLTPGEYRILSADEIASHFGDGTK